MRRFSSEFQRYLWISAPSRQLYRTSDLMPPTFFRLLLAAASIILRPVIVEPVNATLSTSRWEDNAAPPTEPSEGTVLTTPGGNLTRGYVNKWEWTCPRAYPASLINSESFYTEDEKHILRKLRLNIQVLSMALIPTASSRSYIQRLGLVPLSKT